MRLSEQDREALVEYLADLVTFNAGALVEATVGLREFTPGSIAREFAEARLPVEVEAIVARHVAAALEAAADAIGADVPVGFELRPDGSEDPRAAAYVEGLHDAWAIVRTATPP